MKLKALVVILLLNICAVAQSIMLRRFSARGYSFVSLDEAMSDPAYQTKDTLVTTAGPSWLWRWMKSKGMNLSFADDPEPPRWVTDLFRQRL